MTIRILIFASAAEMLGVNQVDLPLPDGATVADALDLLEHKLPLFIELRGKLAIAVNMRYVRDEHLLSDGDELALIPPVSGG